MNQPNRGITKTLSVLISKMEAHQQITHEDEDLIESLRSSHPKITKQSVGYALRDLRKKGLLEGTGVTGIYAKPNGKIKPEVQPDVEAVAIDNLLDAMAKAEPVLKRCKKLLAAFESIK